MNGIGCIVLIATLVTVATASLCAMNDELTRVDSGGIYLVDKDDLAPEVYTDLLECIQSKKPESLVQYLQKNDVTSHELTNCLEQAGIYLSEIKDSYYASTVLHCAAEKGAVKAIMVLIETMEKPVAYKLACQKDYRKSTALHYAVGIEDEDTAANMIIAILNTARTKQEVKILMEMRNSIANSVRDIASNHPRGRVNQILNLFELYGPGSNELKRVLEKKPSSKEESEDDGACKCTIF